MIEKLTHEMQLGDIGKTLDKLLTAKDAEIAMLRAELDGRNGWIKWHGGECPVDGETMVEVELRIGWIETVPANSVYWGSDGDKGDVVAYRIDHEATIQALTDSRNKWRDRSVKQRETIIELKNKLAATDSLEEMILDALSSEPLTLIGTVTKVRRSELDRVGSTLDKLVASGAVICEHDGDVKRYSIRRPQRTMVWASELNAGGLI